MWEELQSLEENIGIKESPKRRFFKDDRDTQSRLLLAMIHFDSFKIRKGRNLQNESNQVKMEYNLQLLKEN